MAIERTSIGIPSADAYRMAQLADSFAMELYAKQKWIIYLLPIWMPPQKRRCS